MSDTDTRQIYFNASKIKNILDTGQSFPDLVYKIMTELPNLELNVKTHGKNGEIEIPILDLKIHIRQNAVQIICQKTKRILMTKELDKNKT